MEMRRVDNNTYDIFRGKGWDNWTRVRKGRSSTYGVTGMRVPHQTLKDLDQVLNPHLPICYGQSFEQTITNLEAMQ